MSLQSKGRGARRRTLNGWLGGWYAGAAQPDPHTNPGVQPEFIDKESWLADRALHLRPLERKRDPSVDRRRHSGGHHEAEWILTHHNARYRRYMCVQVVLHAPRPCAA